MDNYLPSGSISYSSDVNDNDNDEKESVHSWQSDETGKIWIHSAVKIKSK